MHTRHEGLVRHWDVRIEGKHYFKVFEWKDFDTMRAMNPETTDEETLGLFHSGMIRFRERTGGNIKMARKFGEIHLVKDGYHVNIASHEIQHILNNYFQKRGYTPYLHDERMALIAGKVHAMFWDKFYKTK